MIISRPRRSACKTGFPKQVSAIDRLIIVGRLSETAPMLKKRGARRGSPKNVPRLPDLDHSKTAVLQSLGVNLKKSITFRDREVRMHFA
jgi:hypothetical protein